jgi:hypothetical protein
MTERDIHDRAGELEPEALRAQLDTTFRAGRETDQVPLRLAEVVEGQSGRGIQRFSILFHGPADRLLPQGTYTFRHDVFGEFMLFIVPIVGSNAERIVYEACFSRPIAESPP